MRAIRSAAAAAKRPGARHLVAIDVAGPYTLRERCGLGAALSPAEGLRNPTLIGELRATAEPAELAALARSGA